MLTLTPESKLTDLECKELKGKFLDETSYDILVTEDTDCYKPDGSLLFKFRKNIVNKNEFKLGIIANKDLAKASRGRGASAGQIDPNSVYWKKRKILEISKGGWSATYEVDGKKSKMKVQNEVASNAVGYWSETPGLGVNMPCRLTYYSRKDFLKYEDGNFIIQKISNSYKNLYPEMYETQMAQAQIQPKMTICDTPFSTITINRNFRTAVHQDAGDFGFGNLSVLEYGHYHGGYFVFPKYRIAIDMRAGDHLCCDVHEYHGNTELYETDEDKILNDKLPDIYQDNLEIGVVGLNNRYARISLVCYLRDKLKECNMMKLNEELLKPILPGKTKLTVFFVNKLENSENRKKFYNTNWSRVKTHEDALHRIIKYQLINTVVLDDNCNYQDSKNSLGNSKKYPSDCITFLNVESDKPKGIYPLEKPLQKSLAYFIPTWKFALKLLKGEQVLKKYISPSVFLN